MLTPPDPAPEDTPHRCGPRRTRGLALALALALMTSLACAGGPPSRPLPKPRPAPPPALLAEAERLAGLLAQAPAAPAGTLRIRLAFGGEADLDLFVSDPLQETVYFANERAQSGGALEEDRRCGSPPPNIEVVEWSQPPAGRYRIGIDFPTRCQEDAPKRAPYALAIERGGQRTLHRGVANLGVFVPIVDRFDYRP